VNWRSPGPAVGIALADQAIAATVLARWHNYILEQAIRDAVPEWSLAEVVTALQAMRGIDLVVAVTVLAEIGDLSRFQTPRELMGYLGLVPSESSTGGRSTAAVSPRPAMVGRGVSWSKPLGAIGILHVLAARSR
jgi:transposase